MTIPLDPQSVALLVLGGILSVIGWLMMRLYSMWSAQIMEHDEAIKGLPERYATKSELHALGESIEHRLDDIKDAIKEGNVGTRLLLSALIKTEADVGKGIRPE
jgi:hypothetical protein